MKKNKFTRHSASTSQNPSPIMLRKYEVGGSTTGVSCTDGKNCSESSGPGTGSGTTMILNTHPSIENRARLRSNSYGASKDHGYETIPADTVRTTNTVYLTNEEQPILGTTGILPGTEYRKSDGYAHILQKEWKQDSGNYDDDDLKLNRNFNNS